MKKEHEYEISTKFKIFEIRDGLLKERKEFACGRYEAIFDKYESFEEAEQAILKEEAGYLPYIILPVTNKVIKWDD